MSIDCACIINNYLKFIADSKTLQVHAVNAPLPSLTLPNILLYACKGSSHSLRTIKTRTERWRPGTEVVSQADVLVRAKYVWLARLEPRLPDIYNCAYTARACSFPDFAQEHASLFGVNPQISGRWQVCRNLSLFCHNNNNNNNNNIYNYIYFLLLLTLGPGDFTGRAATQDRTCVNMGDH